MIKKVCPNGHVYDQSIYGDTCPLCPTSANSGGITSSSMNLAAPESSGAHTRIVQPGISPEAEVSNSFPQNPHDPTGSTKVSPIARQQQQVAAQPQKTSGPRTSIHRPPSIAGTGEGIRKLVGFLVTYNRTPMGKAFNIYEGRNYVGRDVSCDISIPEDNEMSGKHLLIRYLSGNNKFSFKDEMSSNGTFVNKQLLDEGELQNYDIIRVGKTIFIFIAIPQI